MAELQRDYLREIAEARREVGTSVYALEDAKARLKLCPEWMGVEIAKGKAKAAKQRLDILLDLVVGAVQPELITPEFAGELNRQMQERFGKDVSVTMGKGPAPVVPA